MILQITVTDITKYDKAIKDSETNNINIAIACWP